MKDIFNILSNQIWYIELFVLIGGGLFFIIYTKGLPIRYFFHAFKILFEKEKSKIEGQITPFKALSTSLASTIGMGNIGGVAVAIGIGGPGALFWMWVTAFIGMFSNFFTTTLSLMFKGKDSNGEVQGGTMYIIKEGLSKKWSFMGYVYALACLLGVLPIFQANQLTSISMNIFFDNSDYLTKTFRLFGEDIVYAHFYFGLILALIVGGVILGGIKRIADVAALFVPAMVVIYFFAVVGIVLTNITSVPAVFENIFVSAFSTQNYQGEPFLGGLLGGLILVGVRRASFSSEAGLGTCTLAMGASVSSHPVRQGFISMITPFLDTILVSTLTAITILLSGTWLEENAGSGIVMTLNAFESSVPFGKYLLFVCVFFFSFSSLFSYSYYGTKSLSFVVGAKGGYYYNYIYLFTIVLGCVTSTGFVIDIIDVGFGIMAFPSIISAILLRKKVAEQLRYYHHSRK